MVMTEKSESQGDDDQQRTYVAHLRGARHRGRTIEAASPLMAALAYAEHAHETDADGRLAIAVEDMASGERHCFTVDLDDGEVGAC
jgi:hypothetical protein